MTREGAKLDNKGQRHSERARSDQLPDWSSSLSLALSYLSFLELSKQSRLGLLPILRIPDVDPPSIERNRVDRPPRLDQQVDRVRNLVLPAIRRLHQVTRVEDLGTEHVEAGHHQIRRRVVGLLDHVGDLAVLVSVTHAVPRRLVPRHLLDEERGIGPVLALAPHHVLEVCLKDVVAENEHEVVVDVFLDREQRVCQSVLLALVGVGDRDALVRVAIVVDDHLLQVADDDDELVGAQLDQLVETVREQRFVRDLHHPLGLVLGEGAESRSFAGREYDCLHVNSGDSTR